MNIGALFTGLGTGNNNNGIFQNNRTIWIFLLIAVVIFGFGNGLNQSGPFGAGTSYSHEEFEQYKASRRKGKKHKRRHHHEGDNNYENLGQENMDQASFTSPFGIGETQENMYEGQQPLF